MSRQFSRLASPAVALILAASPLAAQSSKPLPPDSILARAVTFRSIGPAVMGGRITDIAVAENPPSVRGGRLGNVIYVGAATGGVWKSVNGGVSWTPIFDSVGTGGVGAVAVAPSNSDIVWVGTGEPQNMRSSSWGTGVYKSTDGGKTWSKAMLPTSQHIGRIVVDPRDPNVVYVAAVGPLWAPGGERGLFKTTDGGKSWTNTKPISRFTGFTDVVLDPSNPDVVYAASEERERREYGFLPAGPESGLYKSSDAGKNWTLLTGGLPTGDIGRIGVSVCRSRPATLYTVFHARGPANGVFRSDDAGVNWRQVSSSNSTAWYYGQVRCDPTDPEHVIKLNVGSQESYDGGKTWVTFGSNGPHSDHHALWINPEMPDQEIFGNDGGLYFTWDKGRTWDHVENMVVSQFYAVTVDDAKPFYNVFGGLQDNQSFGGPSRTRYNYGPTNADWFRMAGGDGFYSAPDHFDQNIVYTESQEGGLIKYDVRTGQSKDIRPVADSGVKHRYNWSAPILPSRLEPKVVYFAANYLFRSTDRGDNWKVISPDLTRGIDMKTLPMRGAAPDSTALGRNEGTAQFGNISSIDESPLRAGLLVVGTDDGLVQVSRDFGKSWTKTEHFPDVPDTTYVSRVVFSNASEGTVYATFDGHRSNDFAPYIIKSSDFGHSWTAITGDLPAGHAVQVIREHPRQPNLLFVGTEFGAFFSTEGGNHWTQFKSGLPPVPVDDIAIQSRFNDLVLGTHGRGIWILDDLTPLEYLARAKQTANVFLYPVLDQLEYTPNSSKGSGMGAHGFTGQNPQVGAPIAYLVKEIASDAKATLEILDGSGKVVRVLPVHRDPGLYRVVWDMRVGAPLTGPIEVADTSVAVPGAGGRGGRGGGGGGFGGRGGGGNAAATFMALPGNYRARLTITPSSGPAVVQEQRFMLVRDEQVPMTVAELKTLYSYRVDLAAFQRAVRDAQAQVDTAQRAVAQIKQATDTNKVKVPDTARHELEAITKELAEVTLEIGGGARGGRGGGGGAARGAQPPVKVDSTPPEPPAPPSQRTIQARLGGMTDIMNVYFAPSPEQLKTLKGFPAELKVQAARVAKVRTDRLPALLKVLKDAGIEVTRER